MVRGDRLVIYNGVPEGDNRAAETHCHRCSEAPKQIAAGATKATAVPSRPTILGPPNE